MVASNPVGVFGGGNRRVPVSFRNKLERTVEADVEVQLLQTTSTTVAPRTTPIQWKRLTLLARETMIDAAAGDSARDISIMASALSRRLDA